MKKLNLVMLIWLLGFSLKTSAQLYQKTDLGTDVTTDSYDIHFRWDDKTKSLTIDERKGSFAGMLNNRKFNLVIVGAKNATHRELNSDAGKQIEYTGKKMIVKF